MPQAAPPASCAHRCGKMSASSPPASQTLRRARRWTRIRTRTGRLKRCSCRRERSFTVAAASAARSVWLSTPSSGRWARSHAHRRTTRPRANRPAPDRCRLVGAEHRRGRHPRRPGCSAVRIPARSRARLRRLPALHRGQGRRCYRSQEAGATLTGVESAVGALRAGPAATRCRRGAGHCPSSTNPPAPKRTSATASTPSHAPAASSPSIGRKPWRLVVTVLSCRRAPVSPPRAADNCPARDLRLTFLARVRAMPPLVTEWGDVQAALAGADHRNPQPRAASRRTSRAR
jgi:hypothetical protein